MDSNSNADIDLHNRISISSQNFDLKKLASSTVRPKLWRLGGRWGLKLQASAWAQNVHGDQPQRNMTQTSNSKQLLLDGSTYTCRGTFRNLRAEARIQARSSLEARISKSSLGSARSKLEKSKTRRARSSKISGSLQPQYLAPYDVIK